MNVYVFVRIADSCKIETYILFDNDEHFEELWDHLKLNGWKCSGTREINEL
jgi:hypothetical protein